MSPERKRRHMSDPALVLFGGFLAVGCAIDFTIHPYGAVSDPEMRAYFAQYLGPLVRHIGNFELSAAAGVVLTSAKKFLTHSEVIAGEKDHFDDLVKTGYFFLSAGAIAGMAAMEVFPGNWELPWDMAVFLTAFGLSILVTDEVLHRLGVGRQRSIRPHVNGFKYLNNVPSSVDDLNFLGNVPTTLD